ncbi:MAG TPA: valine--tRNA ligase [Atribacteraceae bacterium]|nr:valine--tRNA ligase [Atribacteraceae bacterium]
MKNEETLPQVFEPQTIEEKWYRIWEEGRYFHPDRSPGNDPFCIVIPPPNVTGHLHMGHALNLTLQDVLIRLKRMQGYRTLWLPGTDHAGIATQNVVERMLAGEGLSRHDLGRDRFIGRVWQWKDRYHGRIVTQLKRMGASCDWSRERFTMDEGLSRAVREVFVRLFEDGLIYRDEYIVNWCPRCTTALADIEVDYREVEGQLYFIRYPLTKRPGEYLVVATTRPETMLGDVALAVHPDDERYRLHHGSRVLLPLVGRELPLITDDYVEPGFGTGVLKVTPAHDMSDFELGRKHRLPVIRVINGEGMMSEEAGGYAGLDRYTCRKQVVDALGKQGLLERCEDYNHSVGYCYRCTTAIEPYVSKQWFVRMKELAEPAIHAVEEDRIRFIPERWSRVYFEWMNKIRDWCISRQIWWGHRIPVFYCDACEYCFAAVDEPLVCPRCSGSLRQDEDVLDTWFSSALWPFSTLGWPDDTGDLRTFYPTSVLVTGFDIIFFWVARMIMMGLRFKEDIPFYDVFITPLVRDEKGKKMSKSLGNALDPLDVIEQFGADSLRFALAWLTVQGRDINLSVARIESARNFMNKLWNASRFVLMNTNGLHRTPLEMFQEELELKDRWILSRFERTIGLATDALESYAFGEYVQIVYDFVWGDYCDWFIELAKQDLYRGKDREKERTQNVLVHVLERVLRLLHPVAPFITEEIWQQMVGENQDKLIVVSWPEPDPRWCADEIEEVMTRVQDMIREIRFLRAELSISPAETCRVHIHFSDFGLRALSDTFFPYLALLAKCEILKQDQAIDKAGMATGRVPGADIFLEIGDLIEVDEEVRRLEKKCLIHERDLEGLRSRLDNQDFLNRAPDEIVERERKRWETLNGERIRIRKLIEDIRSL